MSYTALSLVNNDHDSLHDTAKLGNISSTVFSIFFKHFVLAGADGKRDGMYMNGSWGLQPRGAAIPSDLGPTMSSKSLLQDSFIPSNPSATVQAVLSMQIEQLELNPSALFLSLAILCLLLLTTAVVLGWHRRYVRLLPRDVDTLGSVLGFVYGSERLLALARQQDENKIRGETVLAKMGWFESAGEKRWGVEIVGDDIKGDDIKGVEGDTKGVDEDDVIKSSATLKGQYERVSVQEGSWL